LADLQLQLRRLKMWKTFEIRGEDISDGYHTFTELYDHRCLLYINLCLMQPGNCAWKVDPKTPEWVILYLDQPGVGQISYHVPDKFRYLFARTIKYDQLRVWDGHTSEIVLARLQVMADAGLK
jgi:hypothetical protein